MSLFFGGQTNDPEIVRENFEKIRKYLADLPVGGAVWGSVTGTITDQTDLVSYVNGRGFVDASYVNGQGFITASSTNVLTNKTWNGNTIPANYGGTGWASYTAGQMLYAYDATTLAKLPIGTTGQVLMVVAGVPAWAAAGGSGWGLTGNAGTNPSTNFLGTTDNQDLVFKTNGNEYLRILSTGGIKIGGPGSDFYLFRAVRPGAQDSFTIGGSIGAVADRSLSIFGTSTGLLSVCIGLSTTAINSGTAIGGYFTSADRGIAIGSYGNATTSKIVGRGVAINSIVYSEGDSCAINGTIGTLGNNSIGVAINGSIPGGVLNGAVAIQGYAVNQSVGIWGSASARGEFVCGASYGTGDDGNFTITEIYFGSGKARFGLYGNQHLGIGVGYTINGSGANGTNFAGGSVRIAGGKGTGTGAPGDIIFGVASLLGSGTTLQSVTNRWFIKGNTGILTTIATPDSSAIADFSSISKGFLPPRMATTNWNSIPSRAEGLQAWDNTAHGQLWYDGTRTVGFRYNGTKFQGFDGTSWLDLN